MRNFKRTLLALLATTVISSSLAMTPAQAISRPENLNITDITHLQKGIAGLVTLDAETIRTFDVNGDGEIDITEVTYWQKVLAGLIAPEKEPTTISMPMKSVTLGVNDTCSLKASTDISNTTITYTTSNSKVATVSSSGKVTAKATGTATITATTQNGLKATSTVTVKQQATSVTLGKASMNMGIGESYNLTLNFPSGTASYNATASSSNSSVATAVMSNGKCKVTALKAGTAKVTVKLPNGATATCNVTVKPMPTSVSLNKTSITLGVGETFDLNSSIPSNTAAIYRNFYSKNSSIASITKSGGVITAVAPGTTTVYVQLNNGITANCTVTVKNMASSISFTNSSVSIIEGKTYTLQTSIPSGTTAYYKTFTSSNTNVATVNQNGVVTAKKSGTTTITVTLSNGLSAQCTVTVKADPERELEKLINEYRKSLGLKTLTVTTALQKATDVRAVECGQKFSHTRPDGRAWYTVYDEFNISYSGGGECLAAGSSTPAGALGQWKNSKPHNDIITNPALTHMAIGYHEANNTYYWVFIAVQA